ncbi:hypothetical protein [Lactiplantibacillus plantarum]|uniref:hypothetical protein n=1 Tax=Lactiplantibacillus plantarum TaxID=1590 RepID=UPI000A4C253B|nr:hypothetical protein [Lactiplantibacillus plantarum]
MLHTYQTAALNAGDRVRMQVQPVLSCQNKAPSNDMIDLNSTGTSVYSLSHNTLTKPAE